MKVFVGFGYNERDIWIKNLVIPLLQTIGCEILTGEEMQGEELTTGVLDRISESNACIGFTTKRIEKSKLSNKTHLWVIQEMAAALTHKIPTFEIRETGVNMQEGMMEKIQRFEFDESSIPQVLIEVAKFVVKEKKKLTTKIFMLIPQDILNDIRSDISNGDVKCTYRFMHKTKYYELDESKIERFQGGYGIIINKIPDEDALIEINIKAPNNKRWTSGWVSVGLINVQLQMI